jgi:AbrB family looped-hinge helix DNA binding protein
MKREVATLSTKGQLVIPAEVRASLGLTAGTRFAISVDGNRLVLQPITERLVDEMMGMFAGGPSMADELQADRRAEDKKWEEKW